MSGVLPWVLAFVGFALFVILHELGHFAAAKAVGMRVERFSLFFPPTLLSKKVGETEYALGSIPAGGYVKITGMNPDEKLPDEVRTRAYYSQPVWKRITVIATGPLVNVLLAFVLLFVFFALIGPTTGASPEVASIEKGFPAQRALEAGDKVIAVDGVRGPARKLSRQIQRHRCPGRQVDGCRARTPATLLIERDGRRMTVKIAPVYDDDLPGGQKPRSRLGFSYAGVREPLPVGKALDASVGQFWFITRETASLPARIVDSERRKEISGVVGSYEVTRQTIINDLAEVVAILAIISLSLAIVNLFPFLPLDGGHIFWAIVEKVRRRPVPFSVMERAGVIGFMLVIGIFLLGLTNDIGRLSGEGFDVR